MGRINNNDLIYVNIQQPSGSDCNSTVKTTATIEYYNYPLYPLSQLKALKWKVKSNRTLRILPPQLLAKSSGISEYKKEGNVDLMAKACIGVIIKPEQSI